MRLSVAYRDSNCQQSIQLSNNMTTKSNGSKKGPSKPNHYSFPVPLPINSEAKWGTIYSCSDIHALIFIQ